jgi:hypothetical protein
VDEGGLRGAGDAGEADDLLVVMTMRGGKVERCVEVFIGKKKTSRLSFLSLSLTIPCVDAHVTASATRDAVLLSSSASNGSELRAVDAEAEAGGEGIAAGIVVVVVVVVVVVRDRSSPPLLLLLPLCRPAVLPCRETTATTETAKGIEATAVLRASDDDVQGALGRGRAPRRIVRVFFFLSSSSTVLFIFFRFLGSFFLRGSALLRSFVLVVTSLFASAAAVCARALRLREERKARRSR